MRGGAQVVALLWSCISVPLCLLGTALGRNVGGHANNPCRVKRIPSPIPHKQACPTPPTCWMHAAALMHGLQATGSCVTYSQAATSGRVL